MFEKIKEKFNFGNKAKDKNESIDTQSRLLFHKRNILLSIFLGASVTNIQNMKVMKPLEKLLIIIQDMIIS